MGAYSEARRRALKGGIVMPASWQPFVGLLGLVLTTGLSAEARTDRFGVPLPAGARARFGMRPEHNRGFAGRVAYSPDGRLLATASGAAVLVWDVNAGRVVRRLAGHAQPVLALGFAGGGKELVSFGCDDTLLVWDAATGRELRRVRVALESHVLDHGAAFSADGGSLAVTDFTNHRPLVRLWDVAKGQEAKVLHVRADGLAFTADGKALVTAGEAVADGKRTPAVQVWEVATGKEVRRFPFPGFILTAVYVRGNGQAATVAWVKDRGPADGGPGPGAYLVHVWDLEKGERGRPVFASPTMPLWSPVLAPDGKTLAVSESAGAIHVCDTQARKEVRVLQADAAFPVLTFSPDGRRLASSSVLAGLTLWDTASGRGRFLTPPQRGAVVAVAFSPDGRALASCAAQGPVLLQDVASGRVVRPLEVKRVTALAFTPDGRHLLTTAGQLTSGGRGIRLWEAGSGRERPLPSGRSWRIAGFSADGTALALSSVPGGKSPLRPGPEKVRFDAEVAARPELRAFRWVFPGPAPKAAPKEGRADLLNLMSGLPNQPLAGFYRLSPDGTVLAEMVARLAGRPDTNMGTYWVPDRVRLLRAAGGEEVGWLPVYNEHLLGTILAFSPDNRMVVSPVRATGAAGGALSLREVAGCGERLRLRGGSGPVAFTPDGRVLAARRGKGIALWDALTGDVLGEFAGDPPAATALAFSADGKALAAGGDDGTVLVWDTAAVLKKRPRPPAPPKAEELDSFWSALAGADAARAYRAVAALAAAPAQGVSYLRKRLAVGDVRGRAKKLLADLGDERFRVRDKATEELVRLGERVRPDLLQALAGRPALEMRRRIEQVLKALGPPFSSAEGRRLLRAAEALERAATPEARDLLEALADGPADAPLPQEARAALRRLKQRGVAPR
jgi:WD40 repeat protein